MDKSTASFESLKGILRLARDPGQLDDHPWTHSLFVREALAGDPNLRQANPGQQLVGALAGLFRGLQPASPPRQGLRLDPRWGEFGLLAALYFAPFNHGTPFPGSHLEAWGRIDPAILYFVYGRPAEALGRDAIEKYRLVGDELEFSSASTLSDWHRKGLRCLSEIILNRERYLSRVYGEPSCLLGSEQGNELEIPEVGASARNASTRLRRFLKLALAITLLLAIGLVAFKAWKVYQQGRLVYEQVSRLQAAIRAPLEFEDLETAGPLLGSLQGEWAAFRQETRPLLWLGPALGWLPVYGGDLAYAPELSAMADHLIDASVLGYEAARPLLEGLDPQNSGPGLAGLASLLVRAGPGFGRAQESLDQALAVRGTIQAERLSPRLQGLLVEELDPLLALAGEGLSLAIAAPAALGATAEGPKTYLLLVQNEDELRPTGGFITSVGVLVLHNGQVISLEFEGVDTEQEDWSKPYPLAPWQLQEYMNSRVLILRDANWFSDFPTTVLWVEYLYAYTHSHSVDGVIAFDQQFLVMLLGQLGPLEVQAAPYPITDKNVIEYMRQAKIPPGGESSSAGWYRKEFIDDISKALLAKISAGDDLDWRSLAGLLSRALAERHLLLQFDDPQLAGLLAGRDWDNALRPGAGDYLMLTDTNVGFNKTNALVDASLAYDVDLSDIAAPRASLVATHTNKADPDVPCVHWNTGEITLKEPYPVNRCYWDYLRVYKQAGVELLDASPHDIPGEWLLLARSVPARVDELEEEIPGVRGFGTLLVVPGGQSWSTGFDFALPASVLDDTSVPGGLVYRLKVQKQPGTLAVPLTVRIHLPPRSNLVSLPADALRQGDNLLVATDLRTDVELEVVFSSP